MNKYHKPTRYRIAIIIALIDAVLIFFTLQKELPLLQLDLQTPFPQVMTHPGMWFNLAEMLFHSAGLIMVYGMISLILPRLRFVLVGGVYLANLAGVSYLFAVLTSWRSQEPGIAIQQAILMFMVCMILPFLASRLLNWIKRL